MLAFLIPVDALDWQAEYDQLRDETRATRAELARKPHCVVFTKMDLLGRASSTPPIEAPGAFGVSPISAAARIGLDALLAAWWSKIARAPTRRRGAGATPPPLSDRSRGPRSRSR